VQNAIGKSLNQRPESTSTRRAIHDKNIRAPNSCIHSVKSAPRRNFMAVSWTLSQHHFNGGQQLLPDHESLTDPKEFLP
jgi:hypothetical protein